MMFHTGLRRMKVVLVTTAAALLATACLASPGLRQGQQTLDPAVEGMRFATVSKPSLEWNPTSAMQLPLVVDKVYKAPSAGKGKWTQRSLVYYHGNSMLEWKDGETVKGSMLVTRFGADMPVQDGADPAPPSATRTLITNDNFELVTIQGMSVTSGTPTGDDKIKLGGKHLKLRLALSADNKRALERAASFAAPNLADNVTPLKVEIITFNQEFRTAVQPDLLLPDPDADVTIYCEQEALHKSAPLASQVLAVNPWPDRDDKGRYTAIAEAGGVIGNGISGTKGVGAAKATATRVSMLYKLRPNADGAGLKSLNRVALFGKQLSTNGKGFTGAIYEFEAATGLYSTVYRVGFASAHLPTDKNVAAEEEFITQMNDEKNAHADVWTITGDLNHRLTLKVDLPKGKKALKKALKAHLPTNLEMLMLVENHLLMQKLARGEDDVELKVKDTTRESPLLGAGMTLSVPTAQFSYKYNYGTKKNAADEDVDLSAACAAWNDRNDRIKANRKRCMFGPDGEKPEALNAKVDFKHGGIQHGFLDRTFMKVSPRGAARGIKATFDAAKSKTETQVVAADHRPVRVMFKLEKA